MAIRGNFVVRDLAKEMMDTVFPAKLAAVAAERGEPVPAAVLQIRRSPKPFYMKEGCVCEIQPPKAMRVDNVDRPSQFKFSARWSTWIILSDTFAGADPEGLADSMELRKAALMDTFAFGNQPNQGVYPPYLFKLMAVDSPPVIGAEGKGFKQYIGVQVEFAIIEGVG